VLHLSVVQEPLVLLVILSPPLLVFIPKASITIPPIRSKPKSTFLRYQLVETIIRTGLLVIRVYLNCERAGQADKYKVRVSSGRCVECARKGLSDYNLSPFSPVKWTRIWNQRN